MRSVGSVIRIAAVTLALAALPATSSSAQEYNWTGLYGGGHFGAVTVPGADFSNVGIPSGAGGTPSFTAAQVRTLTAGTNDGTERIGGGQIGFNWQVSPAFVIGAEADISAVSSDPSSGANSSRDTGNNVTLSADFTSKTSFDYLGTVRGRLGYLIAQPLMLYVTGGFAYAQTETTWSFATQYPGTVVRPDAGTLGQSGMRTGYTVGGGAEYAVSRNVSVKFEGLYYDLGSASSSYTFQSFNIGNVLISTNTVTAKQDLDGTITRLGINYKF
jgi:outer membrane immunogenic protein